MAPTDEQSDQPETADSPETAESAAAGGRLSALKVTVLSLLPATVLQRPRLALGVTAGLVALIVVSCFSLRDAGPTPLEQLRFALELLEDRDNLDSSVEALKIVRKIQGQDVRDPAFPGAIEYVQGIVAFREGSRQEAVDREKNYIRTSRLLKKAEVQGVPEQYQPEWSYALGTSLHETDSLTDSLRHLEFAVKNYEPAFSEIAARLIDTYLVRKTPEELERALELGEALIGLESLDANARDHVYLQQARVLSALKRKDAAKEMIARISKGTDDNLATIVFRAEALMEDHKFEQASELLQPISEDTRADQRLPRRATYLVGVCAEELGDFDKAISHYERTARSYAKSQEGLAANLRAGDLRRAEGSHEQALQAYRRALQMVRKPEDFRNHWLGIEDFRGRSRKAWNDWIELKEFQIAIDLSQLLNPLLPKVQAYELSAHAHHRWAQHLQDELGQSTDAVRQKNTPVVMDRWRQSAIAYEKYAETWKTSSRYPDILWTAGEHYRHAHDFESGLRLINAFIASQSNKLSPLTFVRRGQVLLNLNRTDEDLRSALDDFQRVVEHYPTDPAAYEAQYYVGKCYVELNENELAQKAWLKILTSDALRPAASEWRLALFSLGRLHYFWGDRIKGEQFESGEVAELSMKLPLDAFDHWNQSIERFEEYLNRYPRSANVIEAKYLLAKSFQQSAALPRQRLLDAQTENSQAELKKTMHELLRQANRRLSELQSDLAPLAENDRLNEFERSILSNSYFEIAHTYFNLEMYEEANTAYGQAAHKYPQDPRIILAFMQKSNCYNSLGKEVEARSMIEQAKVILNQFREDPDDVFDEGQGSLNADDWERWLEWMKKRYRTDAQEA